VAKPKRPTLPLPPPKHIDALKHPTPQKNEPLWADSIFGVDVSVRELDVTEEIAPSFARTPEINMETCLNLAADDKNIQKNVSLEMFNYYTTAVVWARLLDIKAKRAKISLTTTELEYLKLMSSSELNLPQPLYVYVKAIGHTKDCTGKSIWLQDHNLPVSVSGGRTGYHAPVIDANSFNLFGQVPCLRIAGDVLQAQSAPGDAHRLSPFLSFHPTQFRIPIS